VVAVVGRPWYTYLEMGVLLHAIYMSRETHNPTQEAVWLHSIQYVPEYSIVVVMLTSLWLQAFQMLSQLEGIIPALETSHAIAYLHKLCPTLTNENVVINCSGRGDKDVNTVIKVLGM
jgi:tryptophan synthase beta subunit